MQYKAIRGSSSQTEVNENLNGFYEREWISPRYSKMFGKAVRMVAEQIKCYWLKSQPRAEFQQLQGSWMSHPDNVNRNGPSCSNPYYLAPKTSPSVRKSRARASSSREYSTREIPDTLMYAAA